MISQTLAAQLTELGLSVLFALIFACAGRLWLPPALARREPAAISFFAGMSLAYVFVRLLPEIETAKGALQLPGPLPGPYLESLAVLGGCILFFAVGRLAEGDRLHRHDWTRLLVFAAYVALVSYSRITEIEHGEVPALLFAIAMGTHFLALDHALGRDLGALYRRRGRYVLAGASLIGWAVGASRAVAPPVMLLLFGIVAGAVIANTLIKELPDPAEARLGPFLVGSLLYAVILLPFG